MMIRDLRLARALWAITAVLAFAAALAGVLTDGPYVGLFPPEFLPGALPQDVLTLLVSALLLWLAARTGARQLKHQAVALGLLGSLFYLYGIYSIERVYNAYYLLYLAVFACAFWSIVVSLAGASSQALGPIQVGRATLRTTAVVSIGIGLIFTGLWVAALLPLMRERDRIEFMYSIYILDLCFVMPAFFITAAMSLRGKALGVLLGPAIMILGFLVILPLGLNELAKPTVGLPMEVGPLVVAITFAMLMLGLGALQLARLRLGAE